MRYEDAIKIGSAVEGYVRCTYVRLNDVKNGYLYSLQHHDAYKVSDAHIEASEYFDGQANYGGGAASDQVQQDIINTADYSAFVKDVPVVKAIGWDYSWGKQKHVECKLTDYARDVIYRKINSDYHRKPLWMVEKVYLKDVVMQDGFKVHSAGERIKMIETYNKELAYSDDFLKYGMDKSIEEAFVRWYNWNYDTISTLNKNSTDMEFYLVHERTPRGKCPISLDLFKNIALNENGYIYVLSELLNVWEPATQKWARAFDPSKFEALDEVLNKDTTFIVKECAIDWFPTKIDGTFITNKDGKLVTLDMALDAAKKRLDRAKAILAATTTFAIF